MPDESPAGLTWSPYAPQIRPSDLAVRIDARAGTGAIPRHDDPAFQPPRDPLDPASRDFAGENIYRDIPLISGIDGTRPGGWTPAQISGALQGHVVAQFDASGQLVDSVLADPRVQATLASRMSGLFARTPQFTPANDSAEAREACDAWAAHWPTLVSGGAIQNVHKYEIMSGFCPAQINWDTSGEVWLPHVSFWHFRYTYYHWDVRKYIALTLDGPEAIYPGNGKWILHSPRGAYRGWMHGAIRAVAWPWLLRDYARRDMARASERHGMPFIKAIAPASADQAQRDAFMSTISNLGTESSVLLPRGTEGTGFDYDVQLLEANSQMWQIFPGLIDRCDMDIVLAIVSQNLTTEVTSGSLAATVAHSDVLSKLVESDAAAWESTIYTQIARPFAAFNWGDPDLAPRTSLRDALPAQSSGGSSTQSTIPLGVDAVSVVVSVNEARASLGLSPLDGEAGTVSIGAAAAAAKAAGIIPDAGQEASVSSQ